MFLGRVVGTCVATQRSPGLTGVKLLVVVPVDTQGERTGEPFVAADTVGAGPGELVYWVASREAALALEETFVPVDAALIGLVDEVALEAGRGRGFLRGRDDVRGQG